MSVCKSDETLLSICILNFSFKNLLGVSSGDETLHLMFDILHEGRLRYLPGMKVA